MNDDIFSQNQEEDFPDPENSSARCFYCRLCCLGCDSKEDAMQHLTAYHQLSEEEAREAFVEKGPKDKEKRDGEEAQEGVSGGTEKKGEEEGKENEGEEEKEEEHDDLEIEGNVEAKDRNVLKILRDFRVLAANLKRANSRLPDYLKAAGTFDTPLKCPVCKKESSSLEELEKQHAPADSLTTESAVTVEQVRQFCLTHKFSLWIIIFMFAQEDHKCLICNEALDADHETVARHVYQKHGLPLLNYLTGALNGDRAPRTGGDQVRDSLCEKVKGADSFSRCTGVHVPARPGDRPGRRPVLLLLPALHRPGLPQRVHLPRAASPPARATRDQERPAGVLRHGVDAAPVPPLPAEGALHQGRHQGAP